MQFDFDLRIDVPQPVARRFQFAAADVLCSVKNLPLQICELDLVEIDNSKSSHAGCCQVERSRGAQAAGTDTQNARGLKSLLSFSSHFGHDEVTRIALQFCSTQMRRPGAVLVDNASCHANKIAATRARSQPPKDIKS